MCSLITELERPVTSVLCSGVVKPMMKIRECCMRAEAKQQLAIDSIYYCCWLLAKWIRSTRSARLRRIEWDRVEKAGSQKQKRNDLTAVLHSICWNWKRLKIRILLQRMRFIKRTEWTSGKTEWKNLRIIIISWTERGLVDRVRAQFMK